MKCLCHERDFDNKKSLSNHMRWQKGLMSSEMYRGINLEEKNGNWNGKKVTPHGIHGWILRRVKSPKICAKCGSRENIDIANISGKYLRDLSDWEWLCRKCHMLLDGRLDRLHSRKRIQNEQMQSM